MSALRAALPPLLLLTAASLVAGRSFFPTLPGGLPLQAIFALCSPDVQTDNIGPCLADLLRGAIGKARPNFTTGLEIGRDTIVLEPLKLDDVEPKRDKALQVSVSDLYVHGVSTLGINDITFSSNELALNLSFANVTAKGLVKLSYLFLSATPRVHLELSNLTVLVRANWTLDVNPWDPERLDILLHNGTAEFQLDGLTVRMGDLGTVGVFLENIVNNNDKTIVKFLVPLLERSVTKKLNRKLNRIKIAD